MERGSLSVTLDTQTLTCERPARAFWAPDEKSSNYLPRMRRDGCWKIRQSS